MHGNSSEQARTFDFLVFGATGMQGKIVIRDLFEHGHKVLASGRNEEELAKIKAKYPTVEVHPADLNNAEQVTELVKLAKPAVVINCAEGDWNVTVYRAALAGGAHVIDLGSDVPTTQIQFGLFDQFKQQGLTAITGCGSTPGVNNVMLSYAAEQLDTIETIEAGFAWNSNIKEFVVPFSMESIVEEFTQLAPFIENNVWLEKKPMETIQEKEFREVGAQKIFLVRHPEQYTFYLYFKDKGVKNVRYYAGFPEHSYSKIISYIQNSNFEETHTIQVEGKGAIKLIDLTGVLNEVHPFPPGYEEKENLWVILEGTKDGVKKKFTMECIVPTLPDWKDAGCNIDTGLPASIMGQMLLNNIITKRGSFAPEVAVPHHAFFTALREKGMSIWMNGEEVKEIETEKLAEPASVSGQAPTQAPASEPTFARYKIGAVAFLALLISFYLGMLFQKNYNQFVSQMSLPTVEASSTQSR